jgi:cytochrome c
MSKIWLAFGARWRVLVALGITALAALAIWADFSRHSGDPAAEAAFGLLSFGLCADCHSLQPGVHLSGPSLAGIWGRRAGTQDGFGRYSKELRQSGLVWNEVTLDAWLLDAKALVPGNRMIFAGMADGRPRAGLIDLFRRLAAAGPQSPLARKAAGLAKRKRDLKKSGPALLVAKITYCGDSYEVTTRSGEVRQFWEYGLRIKTDGSALGPRPGAPVLVPSGTVGDRAYLVFAAPEEIGSTIQRTCP